MKTVAENMNIMSRSIGAAMRERDPGPIRELAAQLAQAQVDYIDVNIGPARKEGPELIEFVVREVQQAAQRPLSLDTMNLEAMRVGLAAHDDSWGPPLINSIMARPERIEALLPLAVERGAQFIALLYGPEGLPRDAEERAGLAATLQIAAIEAGVPEQSIWYDPVVVPVNSQQAELQGCTEFMMLLPDIAPNSMSICGLSNVSNGAPSKLRPLLNRTYLAILRHWGAKSAIVDGLDSELLRLARDQWPELDALIGRVVQGEPIDEGALSRDELDYVKTARVLLGHSLYSDSWLEL
ncbi:MAG: dihydropteroate synthase [Candidatus Alcyoniella australis]|nr:dihydropteroate synthase [Candidatus Alcyoniella australis]